MFKTLDKEKKIETWKLSVILLAELFGTFAMVFWIVVPSTWNLAETTTWYSKFFNSFVMKAFWVSGFILILIFLLRSISVNLNPAVTLAEVAVGNTSWWQASWMIIIQFIGAFGGVYFAYFFANHIIVDINNPGFSGWSSVAGSSNTIWGQGMGHTLDSVYPVLKLSPSEVYLFNANNSVLIDGLNHTWFETENFRAGSGTLFFMILPFSIECFFTFLLICSVVYSSENNNIKALLIFITLMTVVTLGIHTNNIALNPARLIAPAVISATHDSNMTLLPAYSLIFLGGELLAVLIIFKIENERAIIKGNTFWAIKDEVNKISNEILLIKEKYRWVTDGNKSLDAINEEELNQIIIQYGAEEYIYGETLKEKVNSFVEFLVSETKTKVDEIWEEKTRELALKQIDSDVYEKKQNEETKEKKLKKEKTSSKKKTKK